ncbi:substrate-binding periplasmic protein [Nocardioides panzhihuensis]|uniref:Polar amino acid transport system substrate-binding protein n=1 Tax=Nocardioides panzhihuensis TaxID=860243 RepID=A0A7Z0ISD8_9ACTN|nr:ABC transporter substrate-binding protein [Nocardioides panzhihuensis]NYI77662.1 polar amino acid transport system substrate-binding protein [Nocardioides panzhihuensis]
MNQTKFVVAGAVVLLGAIVFSGQSSGPAPSANDTASASVGGTLRIGVGSGEPAYYKTDGVTKGFDYQMARSVAEGMGVDPEFVEMEFRQLYPALRSGKIDMIGAQVTKTPEGEREFDFSTPYFVTYVSFLAAEGSSIRSRRDVDGKNVAVVDGTIHERFLEEQYEDVNIIRARDAAAAVGSLGRGEVDAFFYGAPYAASILKRAPIRLAQPIVYQAEEAPIAFVVREGDPRKERIDRVIEDMVVNGEWLKIKTDYFEADPLSEVFREKGV